MPAGANQPRPWRPRPARLLVGGDDGAARRPGRGQLLGARVGRVRAAEVAVRAAELGGADSLTAAAARPRRPGRGRAAPAALPPLTASASAARGVLVEQDVARLDVGEGAGAASPASGRPGRAPRSRRPAAARPRRASVGVEVERDVAEAVRVEGVGDAPRPRRSRAAAARARVSCVRLDRLAGLGEAGAEREVGGDRGEQVAPVEGGRDGLEPEGRAREVDRVGPRRRSARSPGQSRPLSGPTRKRPSASSHRDRPALGADPRVDDRQVDARRAEGQRVGERERPRGGRRGARSRG